MLNRSNIPTSPKSCEGCGKLFENNQPIRSALLTSADGKWFRQSWCENCWPGSSERFLTSWRSTFAKRQERRPVPDDALPDLMSRVIEDPEWARLAPLLAWHLVRRKSLAYVDRDDSSNPPTLRFRIISTAQEITLPDLTARAEDIDSFHELVEMIDPDHKW
ncbi:MAG: hypothetical protein Kow00107_09660 [Planctomycetota bacterium]